MSVILTSGKSAVAKMRQPAKKPKKVARPRTALPVDSYLPTEETAVWNTRVNEVHYSVALNKDSLEVWCNDELIEAVSDFSDTGSTVDFALAGKKARIAIKPGPKGTKYEFSLDGVLVSAAKPPDQKPKRHGQRHSSQEQSQLQQQQQQQQLSASCDGAQSFDYCPLP